MKNKKLWMVGAALALGLYLWAGKKKPRQAPDSNVAQGNTGYPAEAVAGQ